MRRDADRNNSILSGIRTDSRPAALRIGATVADALSDLRDGLPWKVVSHLSPGE